jgi:hypothetical protein
MGQLEVKYGPLIVLDGPTNGRWLTRQPTLPGFYGTKTGKIVEKMQLYIQKQSDLIHANSSLSP